MFDALDDASWEILFDNRAALSSDTMDEACIEFAHEYWTEPDLVDENSEAYRFTRRGETMSKVVRDPKDCKSGELHRINWLEENIGVIYNAMVKRGKQVFGEDFHMSWTYFLEVRPFYVKDATRQTCMCVYHMRFEEMATGLINYRKAMRQHRVSNCSCLIPVNSRELRRQLECQ